MKVGAEAEVVPSDAPIFKQAMGLPMEQVNANLDEGLVMRVGITEKSGHLPFHAFQNGYPTMVSANAFWDDKAQAFKFPQATDLSETDFAMDSAGFTAILNFQQKGPQRGMASVFPWPFHDYVGFATSCGASWWSAPDLCCEPEVASNQKEVRRRIQATATMLEGCLRLLWKWQNNFADDGFSARQIANQLKPCVPILQGFKACNYVESLELTMEVWERWTPWLALPALIGVGSVCRRDLRDKEHGLFTILAAIEGLLPKKSRVHLFGVKGTALDELKMMPFVASADSCAYDYAARLKAYRGKFTNSVAHRSSEMTAWMTKANNRLRPSAGDQFRLDLASAGTGSDEAEAGGLE
jgi:hypothetical protein